jgi:hypothetical protein
LGIVLREGSPLSFKKLKLRRFVYFERNWGWNCWTYTKLMERSVTRDKQEAPWGDDIRRVHQAVWGDSLLSLSKR